MNGHFCPFVRLFVCNIFVVSVHFLVNRTFWWTYWLRYSPFMIDFWQCPAAFPSFPGLWLVQQFSHTSNKTVQGILLTIGGYTQYCTLLSLSYLPRFQRICRQPAEQIKLKFAGSAHCGCPKAWLTCVKSCISDMCIQSEFGNAIYAHSDICDNKPFDGICIKSARKQEIPLPWLFIE